MIWLIGNKGMLGTELSETLTAQKIPFVGTDREVDITNIDSLKDFVKNSGEKIEFIVNCAAYTNVNKAESDIELCTNLNVEGPKNIGKLAKEIGATVLHISTDYVFDGQATTPYTEDALTNPTGVYGSTKGDGEKALMAETNNFYIIRTAWLYGKHGSNFVYTMMRVMNENGAVKVVCDQKGTPTHTKDLARAITTFITKFLSGNKIDFGIYHFTNMGETNWFEFAKEIYSTGKKHEQIKRDATVSSCTTEEYPTPAPRPAYSVLSKNKIQSVLDWQIPEWKESLEAFISSLE